MSENTAGRARKQCPGCSNYLHARTLECPTCNHSFGTRKTIIKEPEIFTEGGRGRKQCPSCNKYAGAKSSTCPNCKKEFVKKENEPVAITSVDDILAIVEPKTSKKIEVPQEKIASYTGSLVYTPSGECPFEIKDESEQAIFDWCYKVFQFGLKNNKTYTSNALKYWLYIDNQNPNLKNFVTKWSLENGYESGLQKENQLALSD